MAYIKKLKDNELIGGIDETDVYPITSTQAVYDNKGNTQEELNNHITGDRIVDGAITLEKLSPDIIDEEPINNSDNLVKSGGIKQSIDLLSDSIAGNFQRIEADIDNIEEQIKYNPTGGGSIPEIEVTSWDVLDEITTPGIYKLKFGGKVILDTNRDNAVNVSDVTMVSDIITHYTTNTSPFNDINLYNGVDDADANEVLHGFMDLENHSLVYYSLLIVNYRHTNRTSDRYVQTVISPSGVFAKRVKVGENDWSIWRSTVIAVEPLSISLDGKISINKDIVPTEDSKNFISSGDLYNYLNGKEKVIAAALNDLNERVGSSSEMNIVTELSEDSTDTQCPSAKAVYDVIVENEEVTTASLNDLEDRKADKEDIEEFKRKLYLQAISSSIQYWIIRQGNTNNYILEPHYYDSSTNKNKIATGDILKLAWNMFTIENLTLSKIRIVNIPTDNGVFYEYNQCVRLSYENDEIMASCSPNLDDYFVMTKSYLNNEYTFTVYYISNAVIS